MATEQPQREELLCVREGGSGFLVTVVRKLGGRATWLGRCADLGLGVVSRYGRHHGSVLAGGLAFFTALAITPLIVAFGALAGLLLDPARLELAMQELIAQFPSASVLEPFADQLISLAKSTSTTGLTVAGAVGIAVAIFGSTRIVTATRQILDVAFEHPHARRGLVLRALSVLVILLGIIVMLILVVLLTVVPVVLNALHVEGFVRDVFSGPLIWILVLVLVYALLRAIYHLGPVQRSALTWWSPGAAVVTAWLVLMTLGLNIYVSYSSTLDVAVALLGGVAVLLLWLYLSAMGVVLGAEWEGIRCARNSTKPRRLRTGAS
jgi:membrane protein